MKRTLITILILTVAVTAFAAPQRRNAGPGAPGAPQGERGFLPPQLLAEFLGLSDAQQTQAKAIHEATRAAIEPIREQLRTNREALENAVDAGDAAKAGQLLIAQKALRDQIRTAHDNANTQFEAMLTSEQKAKWAMLKELQELRRQHRDDD